ncbi:MAG TPA: rod shape-determining protein RodA [Burkholderiales bacterium]|nr:rod shape-determining protein RodA [Burkholderiales bacterium]
MVTILILLCMGMMVLYSATYDTPVRFYDQMRNIAVAMLVMWVAAQVPPQTLMRVALPIYTVGIALLIAVAMFGAVRKGARRWLDLGVTSIQPSEIMKIAMPLTLAWYFHKREALVRTRDYLVAGLLLALPVGLIAKQPDLGTAILVSAAGLYVIFFAGLTWKLILPVFVAGLIGIAGVLYFGDRICEPEVQWPGMHDYQKHRICTLLDPSTDPLGKGFHTIQSTIAVGSGGATGKGWLKGTQTHLEFIPERHTDFIFAVYSEEFGLMGNCALLLLYLCLIARGLVIAANAPTMFARLLAGSISMIFFTYTFVNMGMVSGVLPVVGVPLPLVSYGGTALVTLFLGLGILMSVQNHRKLVQT